MKIAEIGMSNDDTPNELPVSCENQDESSKKTMDPMEQ